MRSQLQGKGLELARRAAHSRAGRRLAAAIREQPHEPAPASIAPRELDVDGWLTSLYGSDLARIDAEIEARGGGPDCYELFRGLGDDLWSLLLSRQYSSYTNSCAASRRAGTRVADQLERSLGTRPPEPIEGLLWTREGDDCRSLRHLSERGAGARFRALGGAGLHDSSPVTSNPET